MRARSRRERSQRAKASEDEIEVRKKLEGGILSWPVKTVRYLANSGTIRGSDIYISSD
jgi:hypothetical protein